MSIGFGFTPAIINGKTFNNFNNVTLWTDWSLTHRAGVFQVSAQAAGGGGGGKNVRADSDRGGGGKGGDVFSGEIFLTFNNYSVSPGVGGPGGLAGQNFAGGGIGGSGGDTILYQSAGQVIGLIGGEGGAGAFLGTSLNPTPTGNGGYGGGSWSASGVVQSAGQNGGNGSLSLIRVS